MSIADENIQVEFDLKVESLDADLGRLEGLIRAICRQFTVKQATITICIVDDAGIIEVHKQFLGKDNTTDVISFDLTDEFEKGRTFQFVVNADMAAREGAKRGHGTEAELALYITHGMLHNLGHDDLDEADAAAMHEREDEILKAGGFGVIYHNDENKD
ncbi:MAG: rRNA maturation RNase YbeY [Planctomycetota bacterium]|jgi:probable rRNA maturation factor